jgi:hypothetical protein
LKKLPDNFHILENQANQGGVNEMKAVSDDKFKKMRVKDQK